MNVQQFRYYKAKFIPKKPNLKPGVVEYIGKTGTFLASWIIEPGEPYAGQMAMGIERDIGGWGNFPYTWVPEEDLDEIEDVTSTVLAFKA